MKSKIDQYVNDLIRQSDAKIHVDYGRICTVVLKCPNGYLTSASTAYTKGTNFNKKQAIARCFQKLHLQISQMEAYNYMYLKEEAK